MYLPVHVKYGVFLENVCIVRKSLLKPSIKISWCINEWQIRNIIPGNGIHRDAKGRQGLEKTQRAGELHMVPHFFLTGFKRFTLTSSFKHPLCPMCHSTILSGAKLHPSSLMGAYIILGCKTVNKYTGKCCQTTKRKSGNPKIHINL